MWKKKKLLGLNRLIKTTNAMYKQQGGASVHSMSYILAARERLRGWTVQVRTELGLDRRKQQQQESLRYIYVPQSPWCFIYQSWKGGGGRTVFFVVVILVAVSLFNGMGYGTKQKNSFPAELGSFSPSKEKITQTKVTYCVDNSGSQKYGWMKEREKDS